MMSRTKITDQIIEYYMCMFDKFQLTFNFKLKVSRDVFQNKNEC